MSTRRVEHALQLAPDDLGSALLDLPESQWFERKSGRIRAKKAAETAIAFANAEGGILIVGASNGRSRARRPTPGNLEAGDADGARGQPSEHR